MFERPVSDIGVCQIVSLIPELSLGENEEVLCRALNFRMPTLEEVFAYARENLDEMRKANPMSSEEEMRKVMEFNRVSKRKIEMELKKHRNKCNSFNEEDQRLLKTTHYYYWGHIYTLQRRLKRYTAMLFAIAGLLNSQQYPQVEKDLQECDIELANSQSVELGKQRIMKSFDYVLSCFDKHFSKASKLSSYLDNIVDEHWIMCCSDEERFGMDKLCLTGLIDRLCVFYPDIYIQATERQLKESEERWNKSVDESCKSLENYYNDIILP